jgi:DNA recombination protein RmuC
MTLELGHIVLLLLSVAAGFGLGILFGLRRGRVAGEGSLQQLQQQFGTQRQELEASWGKERTDFVAKGATLQARVDEYERNSERMTQALGQSEQRLNASETRLRDLEVQLERERTLAESTARASEERLKLLTEAREQFRAEFKQLSQQIFDEKTEKLGEQSQKLVEGTISPLREQLGEFKRKIEDVYDRESKDRTSLVAQIHQLHGLNQTLGQQALSLTQALKGQSKVRGNWGEQTLETLLEASGLVKGTDYETQKSLRRDDGGRGIPDVIIHLPDRRDVIIDSKVSLKDYLEYCESDDEEKRNESARAHLASLRGHVGDLAEKDYASLPNAQVVDFVLLFVPIEPALLVALQQESSLFTDAYRRKIIIVGPSTLLATLRTIEGIWRLERQSKNAEEIARRAGLLWDQMALTLESLTVLGKHLDSAQTSYEETINRLSKGRVNLRKRAEALRELGVKGKKELPTVLMSRLEAAEDEDQEPDIAEHQMPQMAATTTTGS